MKIIARKNRASSLGKDDYTGNTGGDAPLYKQKTSAKAKMKIAAWNVRSLANKGKEVEKALEKQKINFAVISETKKKGRGTSMMGNYVLIQSGVEKGKRAVGGIML